MRYTNHDVILFKLGDINLFISILINYEDIPILIRRMAKLITTYLGYITSFNHDYGSKMPRVACTKSSPDVSILSNARTKLHSNGQRQLKHRFS